MIIYEMHACNSRNVAIISIFASNCVKEPKKHAQAQARSGFTKLNEANNCDATHWVPTHLSGSFKFVDIHYVSLSKCFCRQNVSVTVRVRICSKH